MTNNATTTNATTTKVTGDTFAARDVLRQAGFEWDGAQKCWFGTDAAKASLERISRAGYSRKNSKACRDIVIEAI